MPLHPYFLLTHYPALYILSMDKIMKGVSTMALNNSLIEYPVIITKKVSQGKTEYTANSPALAQLNVSAQNFNAVISMAREIIANHLALNHDETTPDATTWKLNDNQSIVMLLIDMKAWIAKDQKTTVKTSVSIPKYLLTWARDNKINVSRAATERLKEMYMKDQLYGG